MSKLVDKLTPGILLAWLLAWTAVVLDPCCEAIASEIPHEHASSHAHGDVHGGADKASHHADEHTSQSPHCTDADRSAPGLFVLDNLSRGDDTDQGMPGVATSQRHPITADSLVRLLPYHTPPPHRRAYLLTQRFRL